MASENSGESPDREKIADESSVGQSQQECPREGKQSPRERRHVKKEGRGEEGRAGGRRRGAGAEPTLCSGHF